MNFLKYITLGFEVLNAVTTIVAMIQHPQLLDADLVWAAIKPVIAEVASVAKITVNMELAKTISDNAVSTIKAALVKTLPAA